MDILAARKKAAERAKAARAPGEQEPARNEPQKPEEPLPAFPPLPETEYLDDAPLLIPEEEAGPAAGTPEQEAAAPATTADTESAGDTAPETEAPAEAEEELPAEEQEREMLAFLLGKEEYVIAVDMVQEVLTPREITQVPRVPDHILGVCSLRGVVLPVLDVNRRLGLARGMKDERSRIIVVNMGHDDRIGLYVDRIRGVVRFPLSAVRPVPDTIEQGAEFLQGIVRKEDRLFIVLDLEKTAEI
jgi:purine-binding chemotaxis protein CheW